MTIDQQLEQSEKDRRSQDVQSTMQTEGNLTYGPSSQEPRKSSELMAGYYPLSALTSARSSKYLYNI